MKEGYYWVRYHDEWTIARRIYDVWYSALYRGMIEPVEIGDYIEMPEKYKEEGK